MERQAESCCHRAPACRVFLDVLGTRTDVRFHTDRRRTVEDSGDSRACQLPPNISDIDMCLG